MRDTTEDLTHVRHRDCGIEPRAAYVADGKNDPPVGQASGANGVKEAFEALPAALKPVGNFYIIRSCQNAPHKVTLKLTIPPTVDALNAIDLYAWDASTRAWRWPI